MSEQNAREWLNAWCKQRLTRPAQVWTIGGFNRVAELLEAYAATRESSELSTLRSQLAAYESAVRRFAEELGIQFVGVNTVDKIAERAESAESENAELSKERGHFETRWAEEVRKRHEAEAARDAALEKR